MKHDNLRLYAAQRALELVPDTSAVLTEAWASASAAFSKWLEARYGKLLADETQDQRDAR